ncbi:flavin reductase [Baekduia sp. Peel2402]|uniref:flavin reductase n=1 Tax=Baekduia sp. Peel2402 TaxID=3458296 RepID=UPI00403EB9FA
MGHFATGVSIVTAADVSGRPFGTTANAISSVSLDPPLVLACLRRESETLEALRQTGKFTINLLGADQRELSDRFAKKARPETWDGVGHRLPDGVPVLDASLATVECVTHELAEGGDHVIVIGRVVAVSHPDEHEEPLLFYRGRYATLGEDAATVEPSEVAAESVEIALPSALGAFRMVALDDGGTVEASVAVVIGAAHRSVNALLYVHRGCLLGDALGSQVCKGRERLHAAVRDIEGSGRPGVIVYHRDSALGFGKCCMGGTEPPPTESERAAVREAVARLGLRDPELLEAVA